MGVTPQSRLDVRHAPSTGDSLVGRPYQHQRGRTLRQPGRAEQGAGRRSQMWQVVSILYVSMPVSWAWLEMAAAALAKRQWWRQCCGAAGGDDGGRGCAQSVEDDARQIRRRRGRRGRRGRNSKQVHGSHAQQRASHPAPTITITTRAAIISLTHPPLHKHVHARTLTQAHTHTHIPFITFLLSLSGGITYNVLL